MSDPIFFRYSGLSVFNFSGRPRLRQTDPVTYIKKPFPARTIISSLKFSNEIFLSDVPKGPMPYKVFFVTRDPRELIVSWYHSTKKNHLFDKNSRMWRVRQTLSSLDEKSGLTYTIKHFIDKGKFDLLRSWAGYNSENFIMVKYEDLISTPIESFRSLFQSIDVQIPEGDFLELINAYSFETLTGRQLGEIDTDSHMRGGGRSSWQTQLSQSHLEYIYESTGSLITDLGYRK